MSSDPLPQRDLASFWDCAVVGGGAAGLSAALVLGRARRRTLLLDAGEQSNLPAAGIGGLLGSDGRPPADLYATGRAELAAYPSVEVRAGERVVGASPEPGGFALELGDGSRVEARKVLLAPGMEYRPPQIPGLREHWGHSVFHCPFCHGWEVRGRRLGVLGAGAVQKAILLRAWSEEVTLLTNGEEGLGEERALLDEAGIAIEPREIELLRSADGALSAVVFADGSELALDALLVHASLHQRSPLATQLGVELASNPLSEELIAVDSIFRTSVAGVFAAGDVCGVMPSVATAVASGSTAAASIVRELTLELSV
jgi:thioredoxin reductase